MIEETLYQKKKLTKDSTSFDSLYVSRQFKNSCIGALRKALYEIRNSLFRTSHNDPFTVIVLECASFSGIAIRHDIITQMDLNAVLGSIDDALFIETLEDACHEMYKRGYNYGQLEQSLNVLFKRNNMPFKCNNGQFIDSSEETLYNEVISPCLSILINNGFETADGLLRESFTKYHENDNKDAILKCSMALDSVIDKIITDRGLSFSGPKNDFNGKMALLREKGLLPDFYDKEYGNHLKELLHSPLKIRNNEPNVSHGRAEDPLTDDNLVKYTIDATSSSILFIVREYLKHVKSDNRWCLSNTLGVHKGRGNVHRYITPNRYASSFEQ